MNGIFHAKNAFSTYPFMLFYDVSKINILKIHQFHLKGIQKLAMMFGLVWDH
ncbi:MAG: hypothetical protein LBI80_05020 [Endomicrobium sp.]|nr:hypothetical protein [Endomicrobium sp.]